MASLTLLAESYLHEGDAATARKVIEEGLVRVGLEPRLLDLLAEACERTGDLRAAADALERARVVQPESLRLGRRLRGLMGRFYSNWLFSPASVASPIARRRRPDPGV